MVAPALPEQEALRAMVAEFAAAIREHGAAAAPTAGPACACCRVLGGGRQQPARSSGALRRPSRSARDREQGVCLVTGGAGTIGSTIVDQLVAAGAAEIRVLDNFVRGRRANLAPAFASGRVSWSRATSATATSSTT